MLVLKLSDVNIIKYDNVSPFSIFFFEKKEKKMREGLMSYQFVIMFFFIRVVQLENDLESEQVNFTDKCIYTRI